MTKSRTGIIMFNRTKRSLKRRDKVKQKYIFGKLYGHMGRICTLSHAAYDGRVKKKNKKK